MSARWKYTLMFACLLAGSFVAQIWRIPGSSNSDPVEIAKEMSTLENTRDVPGTGDRKSLSTGQPSIVRADSDGGGRTRNRMKELTVGTNSAAAELDRSGTTAPYSPGVESSFAPTETVADRNRLAPPELTPTELEPPPNQPRRPIGDIASIPSEQSSVPPLSEPRGSFGSAPSGSQDNPNGIRGKVVLTEAASFWTLSEQAYGTGVYFKALYVHNQDRIARPDLLQAGDEIVVPELDELKSRYPQCCPTTSNTLRTAKQMRSTNR